MKVFLLVLLIALGSCGEQKMSGREDRSRPNVVIILADDLGYGDPGAYNEESKIPTPHIDALARSGLMFTDAHTPSSVCTPTRYALLTGRYAWRSALQSSVLWMWDPPLIERDRPTLPGMMAAADYHTACIGKWHLGWRWPATREPGYANDTVPIGNYGWPERKAFWKNIDFSKALGGGPLEAGFDYYFGDDVPNFAPYTFIENDAVTRIPDMEKPDSMYGGPGPMASGWRLEDVMPAITDKAVQYISAQSEKENPFFLYFALTAPHTPIAPTDEFKGKSQAGLYGDFVHEVDWSVGRIMAALGAAGSLENTIVIFTSDNGSPQRDGAEMGGKIASVKEYGHDPSRPWRGMKADIWEGGHRVPFIISWPGQVKAGKVTDQLICHVDIYATLANLLGRSLAENAAEDSFDFTPVLTNTSTDPVRQYVIHHSINGTFAIRKGDWKLILGKDSGGFSRNIPEENIPTETDGQLYNLTIDPGERNNLYAENSEVVNELSVLLDKYRNAERTRK